VQNISLKYLTLICINESITINANSIQTRNNSQIKISIFRFNLQNTNSNEFLIENHRPSHSQARYHSSGIKYAEQTDYEKNYEKLLVYSNLIVVPCAIILLTEIKIIVAEQPADSISRLCKLH